MSTLSDLPLELLQFYVTAPYPCSYLDARQARSQVVTPTHLITSPVYSELAKLGFRRSGHYVYRPWCDRCRACIPVRIRLTEFVPNRSQKRAWQKHQRLQAHMVPRTFSREQFQLYQRYQKARHTNGGMDHDSEEQFAQFLLASPVDTQLVEFRDAQAQLVMVSVIDRLTDGWSSVYTFYDPHLPGASLGTYNVLWQAEQCRQQQLPYLYLGYWITDSQKMAYKANFQPLECFIQGCWQTLPEIDDTTNA